MLVEKGIKNISIFFFFVSNYKRFWSKFHKNRKLVSAKAGIVNDKGCELNIIGFCPKKGIIMISVH